MGERVSVAASVVVVALVALACKGFGAASTEDAGAAPVATASAAAAPELERYSDEENPDAIVVTLKKATTARLSADTSSKIVGELKVGDKILPIAIHGDYALVALGTDPSAASKGWIPGEVIIDALKPKAAVAAKAALPKCKDAELLVRDKVTGQPRCAAQCTEDADCAPGKCSDGLVLDDKTGKPAVVNGDTHMMSVCNAAAKSSAKKGGLPVHATPGPTVDEVKRSAMGEDPMVECPDGWVANLEHRCNRPCNTNADCHGKNTCQTIAGPGCDKKMKKTWECFCGPPPL